MEGAEQAKLTINLFQCFLCFLGLESNIEARPKQR